MYTYNCDMLEWIGEVGAFASIGFSVLGDVDTFRNFENYGLSRLRQVRMVACSNARLNRPWTNLIYKIGIVTNREQRERSMCLNRLAADQVKYTELAPFSLGLVDCPCSYFQVVRDSRFFFNRNFPGEKHICFYTTFAVFTQGGYAARRCCYDISR